MVYRPRNISRTPFMNRLKEMTNAMLEEATVAQRRGAIFNPSAVLDALLDSVYQLRIEDEKRKLEYHQREAVNFAQKFATFIEKLRGIRLRTVSESELVAFESMEAQAELAHAGPPMIRKNGVPVKATRVLEELPGPSTLSADADPLLFGDMECEDVKDILKEEPLCEVDATPYSVEPLHGPPGTISVLKKEIKEEEPDEPSTSSAMQPGPSNYLEDNDVFGGMRQPPLRPQPLSKPPPKQRVRDGMNFKVVPYENGQEPPVVRRRAPKRPSIKAYEPPSKKSVPFEDTKLEAFLEWKKSTATAPSTSFVPASRCHGLGTSTSVFDHLGNVKTSTVVKKVPVSRVIERTETYDVVKETLTPSGEFNLGRRIVKCEFCTATIDEREIVKHIKLNHGPDKRSVGMRCQDFACDFICKTEKERLDHAESVHREPYNDWKSKGRFKLQKGTKCPYCLHQVNDLFALCKHLFHDHALKISSQTTDIYSCSACNARFPRLHLVYEHWHEIPCIGATVKIDRCAATIPPPAIIEEAKDITVGSKSKKVSQQIVEKD